jgi:hypothetical protein
MVHHMSLSIVRRGEMAQEPWALLGDAIGAIRSELARAEKDGRASDLKFVTGPVELELSVEVRAEGGGKAKVFVLPWSAEGHVEGSRDRLHRLKMTLQPVDESGAPRKISDRSAERPK